MDTQHKQMDDKVVFVPMEEILSFERAYAMMEEAQKAFRVVAEKIKLIKDEDGRDKE
ncbi:MAG: hypothetical protein LBN74_09980 [Prevotella sp.]|jgi:hypothetical protein|nr:hypothetical protein [Prevotella sp.]